MKFIFFIIFFFNTFLSASCEDTLFAFDIPNKSSEVKIIDIVENMATECRFSVKIKDKEAKKELQQVLSLVHIENYTLEDMFNFLFTQNNIFYKFNSNKNLLSISYLETKSFIIDYVNLDVQKTESIKNINVGVTSTGGSSSTSGNSDSTIVTSTSEFTFWTKLEYEINNILSRDGDYSVRSSSTVNKSTGMITITGTNNQLGRIEKYLKKLNNRMHKQVLLEAKIIEVIYTDSNSKGINWNKFYDSLNNGSFQYNLEKDGTKVTGRNFSYSFAMTDFFKFLNTYGKIHVISTPKIMTLNNQPAVINAGQQINYRFQSSDSNSNANAVTGASYTEGSTFVGLILNIVPEITDDGYVILKINPVISSLMQQYDETTKYEKAPDIKIKQLSSIVKAKNNERVVIGGLVSYSKIDDNNQLPILGSIPLLGYAFKSTSEQIIKKELIIVVTPTIIGRNQFPSIESLENTMEECEDE